MAKMGGGKANAIEVFECCEVPDAPVRDPVALDRFVRRMTRRVFNDGGRIDNPVWLLIATEPTERAVLMTPIDGHYDRRKNVGPGVTRLARELKARSLYLMAEIWTVVSVEGRPLVEPRFAPRRGEALMVTVEDPARDLVEQWVADIARDAAGKPHVDVWVKRPPRNDWDNFERLLPAEVYARHAPGAQA